jgi:hypothetical protein
MSLKNLSLRLTDDEYAKMKALSKKEGLTIAGYVKQKLLYADPLKQAASIYESLAGK